MQIPWSPSTPIEVLFTQLDDGIAYATAGDETLSETQVIRIGYNIVEATGLFELPCRDWWLKARADKTMQTFKTHFSHADVDRASRATTGTAGFQGAVNHVAATPPISEELTQAQIIAETVTKQAALAMAALNVNANTRTNAPRRPRPTAYCWTHGLSKNGCHTSSACNNRAEGHQETATKDSKMGGSDRVFGRRPEEWERGTASHCVNHSSTLAPSTSPLASFPPTPIPKFPTDTQSTVIADTGATGHFLNSNAPYYNKQSAEPGISVMLPDGACIKSTHTAQLIIPQLPPAACEAHIFPHLASGSLISIGQLCDHGCTALFFDATTITIRLHNQTILTGTRSPITRLWTLDLPTKSEHPNHEHYLNTITNNPNLRERIAFYHATMFSPAISTWCNAIDAGHMTTWPALTSAQVRRYPPQSNAMVKGHLDQQRANLRSTKPRPTTDVPRPSKLSDDDCDNKPHIDAQEPFPVRTAALFADCQLATGQIYTDPTGRFLVPSTSGSSYMLVLYDFDSNYIHVEPMASRSKTEHLAA
jgi:hypothetical protein